MLVAGAYLEVKRNKCNRSSSFLYLTFVMKSISLWYLLNLACVEEAYRPVPKLLEGVGRVLALLLSVVHAVLHQIAASAHTLCCCVGGRRAVSSETENVLRNRETGKAASREIQTTRCGGWK